MLRHFSLALIAKTQLEPTFMAHFALNGSQIFQLGANQYDCGPKTNILVHFVANVMRKIFPNQRTR